MDVPQSPAPTTAADVGNTRAIIIQPKKPDMITTPWIGRKPSPTRPKHVIPAERWPIS